MERPAPASRFYFVGNNLALDFVNTEIAAHGAPLDLLGSLEDFAAWARDAGVLPAGRPDAVRRWGAQAAALPPPVRAFRAALSQLFQRLIRGQGAPAESLAGLNAVLAGNRDRVEVRRTRSGFEKHLIADYSDPLQILVPVAQAAADLLCFGELRYLRKCENPDCVLLFYDTTKNHRRRWCSMAACGNRAKAAAFYRRRKRG